MRLSGTKKGLAATRGRLSVCIAITLLPSCTPVEKHYEYSHSAGTEYVAGIGDNVIRVDVNEDLPNVAGRADLWGRTRYRGYDELKYGGLDEQGRALLVRSGVEVVTNENTVNRSGLGTAMVQAQPLASGYSATGFGMRAPDPSIGLAPDAIAFAIEVNQGNKVPFQGRTIIIREAAPTYLRYLVADSAM
jgi:hypothetical protein